MVLISAFFVLIYPLYVLPIDWRIFLAAAVIAVVGGLFCEPVMPFILVCAYRNLRLIGRRGALQIGNSTAKQEITQ